jgi:tagatose 6-phosphate kinase
VILTVTPNPALDVTYAVPRLVPGEVHRVRSAITRAGGKGVNVARVLAALGVPNRVLGLSGGPNGARLVDELESAGLDVAMVDALPDVRRTVVVHGDDAIVTSLWEAGPPPRDPRAAAQALLSSVTEGLVGSNAVTVSGSLPVGVDVGLPARLARACAEADVPAVLDLDGDALRAAADQGGAVLVPNEDELEALTGERVATVQDVAGLVRPLVGPPVRGRPSALGVVVTLGPRGLVAVMPHGSVHARLPVAVVGNPTGAGDAACAAVARCLSAAGSAARIQVERLAAEAVATAAAAVLCPVAGQIDVAAYQRWLPSVIVEQL